MHTDCKTKNIKFLKNMINSNLSQNVCKQEKFNNADGILILRKYFRYETTNFAPKGQGSARSL